MISLGALGCVFFIISESIDRAVMVETVVIRTRRFDKLIHEYEKYIPTKLYPEGIHAEITKLFEDSTQHVKTIMTLVHGRRGFSETLTRDLYTHLVKLEEFELKLSLILRAGGEEGLNIEPFF